mmetsp:Transcript_97374/g.208934  ORF Transcript_97374/g.208934 Transcript_97374/m.208934 type:complete len:143 (-) Transcript_97374:92-520(-)
MGCCGASFFLGLQKWRAGVSVWFIGCALQALVRGQVPVLRVPYTLLVIIGAALLLIIGQDFTERVVGAEVRKSILSVPFFLQTLLCYAMIASVPLGAMGAWTLMHPCFNGTLIFAEFANLCALPLACCGCCKDSEDTTKKMD